MKKLFWLFALLCSVMFASAQTYIWKGGALIATAVDSVTFAEPSLTPDPVFEGALPGLFSVNETMQVRFSQGNLQCTQPTQIWSFAAHQYDYIGTDNVTGGTVSSDATLGVEEYGTALADKIDLFGWSGSTAAAQWGISISKGDEDYSGGFVDWGRNAISNGGNQPNLWRTLTFDEWAYMLNDRENADDLKGVVKIDLGGGEYVNGLVLLPDNWQQPAGIPFTSGFSAEYSVVAYGDAQTLSLSSWNALEYFGAVFLPASGIRSAADAYYVDNLGYYWSAPPYDENFSGYFGFYSDEAYMNCTTRDYGLSVRLVQDAQ